MGIIFLSHLVEFYSRRAFRDYIHPFHVNETDGYLFVKNIAEVSPMQWIKRNIIIFPAYLWAIFSFFCLLNRVELTRTPFRQNMSSLILVISFFLLGVLHFIIRNKLDFRFWTWRLIGFKNNKEKAIQATVIPLWITCCCASVFFDFPHIICNLLSSLPLWLIDKIQTLANGQPDFVQSIVYFLPVLVFPLVIHQMLIFSASYFVCKVTIST